jgi:hypothetical protein
MLTRLELALERERTFVDDASHELRTPLALHKTELELALRYARTPDEMRAAIASAITEVDRLSSRIVNFDELMQVFSEIENWKSLIVECGFLDGMAVATLTGRCWHELAARIPGFRPLPDDAVTLIGARDLDPLEADALSRSHVRRVSRESLEQAIINPPEAGHAGRCYVHLDLDVLDPSQGRINSYAADDGLTVDQVRNTIDGIARQHSIAVASATAFDPAHDLSGRALASALALCAALADLLHRSKIRPLAEDGLEDHDDESRHARAYTGRGVDVWAATGRDCTRAGCR